MKSIQGKQLNGVGIPTLKVQTKIGMKWKKVLKHSKVEATINFSAFAPWQCLIHSVLVSVSGGVNGF